MRFGWRLALLLALVFAALPAGTAGTAGAQSASPGYIQINNGTIVTNLGQRPQVVVQFGNRGSTPIAGYVACFLSSTLVGAVVNPQRGPFPNVSITRDRTWVVFYDTQIGPATYGIVVPPGQNHNVAFEVNVTAPAGTQGSVLCRFHGGYKGPLWGEVTVPIVVQ
jgi:hypothetical protein